MADFSLRQLELLSELPRHATLGSAAAELRISESALSQAITLVEKSVGEQLCIRRKAHGVQMTTAGLYFAEKARQVVAGARELADSFPRAGGELRGPVNIGCFASFAGHVVPAVLEGFPALHPHVEVSVRVGSHDDLLPALQSGQLDLAFVYDLLLPLGLGQQTLYDTQLEVILHPDHPLAAQDSISLWELEKEPLIMYESSPSTENTERLFADAGLRPNIAGSFPQLVMVCAMVGRGLGYGLLMARPNNPALTLEGLPLAVRPLRPPNSPSAVVAIWPEGTVLSPRASALLDHAQVVMADAFSVDRG